MGLDVAFPCREGILAGGEIAAALAAIYNRLPLDNAHK